MAETMVRTNGADLCVETFGDPGDAAVLLISGATCSMDWWDTEFCQRLAENGRFVVRYDHRDTGRSVCYPPGAPGYTGHDLVGDAAGLVDALTGGRAHLVGISMGGGIAQQHVVDHPDQVATLTLMSTSPIDAGNDLPPMADRLESVFADPAPEPNWTDRDAVVEYLVEGERPFAGPGSFDEAHVREVARRVVERSLSPESAKNHWLLDGGDEPPPRLDGVTAPTLVIHGTEDPLFPPEHAVALTGKFAGAALLLLDGVGHQMPPRSAWDLVVPAILRHTEP
ncbi:Pimeloyl-ACP methyl ester carboxylesterase [Amycolatopsis arida]|uniref:Pimeloyl-ACP methyl ester carboxylesterase n=1 Tax=Amycolatopsis arida TaxID=587909 RepID=A0A1I5PRK3_9PSEU|nr:alpha/beta hydrolase [Amycolatopsis arida]TDX98581.1 pimeloyl-ACP methyl ester carboxylesterase [Amycolatopsis arida]SFP36633.1 Pimeloyl-ACP methyl ester carboxylesterase [Amycolatopsis arida]